MKCLLLLFALSISVYYSYACTCLPLPKNGCGSDYSIQGCVLRVKKVGKTQAAQFVYTVAVKRVFKRPSSLRLRRGRVVQIKAAVSSAACGVSLKAKKTYVISGSAKGHILRTNACQYVREWSRIPHDQRKSLNCRRKQSGYGKRRRDSGYGKRGRDSGYGKRRRDSGYGKRGRDSGYGKRRHGSFRMRHQKRHHRRNNKYAYKRDDTKGYAG